MRVSNASIAGYVSYLGLTFGPGWYSFDCQDSYKTGSCLLEGSPQVERFVPSTRLLYELRLLIALIATLSVLARCMPILQDLATACSANPRCLGFSAFPGGKSFLGDKPMGYLLGGDSLVTLDLTWATLLNPQAVLYINASALPQPALSSPSASAAMPQLPLPASAPPAAPPPDKGSPPQKDAGAAAFQTAGDATAPVGLGSAVASATAFLLGYANGALKQSGAGGDIGADDAGALGLG